MSLGSLVGILDGRMIQERLCRNVCDVLNVMNDCLYTLKYLDSSATRIAVQLFAFDQEEVTESDRTCTRSCMKNTWYGWDTSELEFESTVVNEYGDGLRGRIARDCQLADDREGE